MTHAIPTPEDRLAAVAGALSAIDRADILAAPLLTSAFSKAVPA